MVYVMATVRKRVSGKNVSWYAEVCAKGVRRGKSFPTKNEALQWALSTEQSLGKHGGIVSKRTLGEAMEKYAREISPQKKGARWEAIRLKKIGRDKIASTMLSMLTSDLLQEWVDAQCKILSPSSVNRDFTVLASVLKAARLQWKWMVDQPTKDVRRPKDPPARDRRITEKEIFLIMKALQYEGGKPETMRQQIAIAFLLALETAMRQGEIWGLEWRCVHLKERYITLEVTKNGTRRDVPLSKRAVELLELMPKTGEKVFTGCSQAVLEATFRRSVKLAGIENLHFHDARHEAITRLARKVDVLDLARMVGHRDLRSLQSYYNATAAEIAGRLD